ncbi:MAG: UDP-N-acetylmuramate--L-alanine ligase [Bacteroidaceae bacterium]|nr:UDP-N-acetylmuramate--L-alanine ligase [Bacteroidaceae bacterium]
MELDNIKAVYFIGIGGIGMSAIARYFLHIGTAVGGYDKTPSELTERLVKEGAQVHYEDDVRLIPEACTHKESTLVIYTPAIPSDHTEMAYFRQQGFEIQKRAQVLGTLTRSLKGLCVAGTHGKTTTSSMAAHLLHQSHVDCNAFLGGITKNYGTNYILSERSPFVVIEADEFDRSFHWLTPFATVITSTDADHLDIYGTEEAYLESFRHYTSLIQPGGTLVLHTGLKLQPATQPGVTTYTYGREEGDFHAEHIQIGGGEITFDLVSPLGNIPGIRLGVPIAINIENGIGAMALAQLSGATGDEIRDGMATFRGVDRRFDIRLKTDKVVYISDYAHHPAEIRQSILSIKQLYEGRRIKAIFQPHLYTRTRDFYTDFAAALSLLDDVVIAPIYPAREQPIPGVTSALIYDNLRPGIRRQMCGKDQIMDVVRQGGYDVLVTLGAGDIENYAESIVKQLSDTDRPDPSV